MNVNKLWQEIKISEENAKWQADRTKAKLKKRNMDKKYGTKRKVSI